MFSAVRPVQAKKRCLITGASGFVGQNICRDLLDSSWELVGVRHSTPLPDSLRAAGVEEEICDLRDLGAVQQLLRRAKCDLIVHSAGNRDVTRCERDPQSATLENVVSTENLLQAAESSPGVERFFFLSSDMVFDGAALPSPYYTEDSRPLPLSVYARSKFQAECTVLGSTLPVHILRLSLVYGPGENNALGWMRKKFSAGERLPLFFDEFRTPLCVHDLARVLQEIDEKKVEQRLIHLGGPTRVSRVEYGKIVAEVFGFDVRQIDLTRREEAPTDCPRPADLSLHSPLLLEILDSPLLEIREGLSRISRADSWW